MRDPDLVHRAERAADALERAWDRWRTMHGLGTDPLPPVSSYVGYSLEEPWGQPRVVFGVAADEAEHLAAVLDGHSCVGPVYAEIAASPSWRHAPVTGPALPPLPPADQVSVPPQAPQPGADMYVGRQPARIEGGATAVNGHDRAQAVRKAPPVVFEEPDGYDALSDDLPVTTDAIESGEFTDQMAGGPDDEQVAVVGAVDHADAADAVEPESAESESAGTAQPGGRERPGIVAFRRRQGQDPSADAEPDPRAFEPEPESSDSEGHQGPGYRGPRYQGRPPRYRDNPDAVEPGSMFAAAPVPDEPEPAPARQVRAKARQLSRLGRSRRQGPGAHEAWDSDGDQPADHAV
jgi:hypothetical protein